MKKINYKKINKKAFIFIFLILAFSPLFDTLTQYLPKQIAEKIETKTAFAAVVSIDGTCKQVDQSTDCTDTAGNVIRVAVAGVLQAQTDTTVDGAWSIAGVTVTAGQIVTIYIEGETASSSQAVAVTEWSSGNITGVQLMEAHLSIGSDQRTNISNVDLSDYDSSVSGKKTFHDVTVGGVLTVDVDSKVANEELYIKGGNTYQPDSTGGDQVKTYSIEINGTFDLDTNVVVASGSWDNNGLFIPNTGSVSFTGIGSETVSNVASAGFGRAFYNLKIDSPNNGGTVTFNDYDVIASGQIKVETGDTLSLSSGRKLTQTGATLFLNGTISGAGRFVYRSATAFPTTGTISSILVFDAQDGTQTMSNRTYGGQVEITTNSTSTDGIVIMSAGTLTLSSNLYLVASTAKNVIFSGTTNNPTVNIAGDVDYTGAGAGVENIQCGTSNWDIDGNLDISAGVFTSTKARLYIGGNYTNTAGVFNDNNGIVYFNAASGAKTLSGTMNGTDGFYKIYFDTGSGGSATWTITDPIIASASNATDAFVIKYGTVTLGDGNGDNLAVWGKMVIATTSGETGTFQTTAVSEGSNITVDINQNTSTPSCANCIVQVGSTAGAGQGNLKLKKNTVFRLNPRSAATASDTSIQVESTGYFEVLGSQETTNTVSSIIEKTASTSIIVSGTPWTADQFNGNVIRFTSSSSLAFNRTYTVIDTFPNKLVVTATRSAQDTAPDVQGGTACSGSAVCKVSVADTVILFDRQFIGRYLHNVTDDNYYRIASTSETTTDYISIITNYPNAYTTMGDNDTVEVTDGIRAGDAFEIIDYAHITSEDGTACSASVNSGGEGYILAKAGSETLIKYAEICNLGRGGAGFFGLEFDSVNGLAANEGVTIERSLIRNNVYNIAFLGPANNNGTKGIIHNVLKNSVSHNIYFNSASNNLIKGNYIQRGYVGIYFEASDYTNQILYNRIFDNDHYGVGFAATSDRNTIKENFIFDNGFLNQVPGVELLTTDSGNLIIGNHIHSHMNPNGIGMAVEALSQNNTIASNSFYNNARSGFVIDDSLGNTIYNNLSYSNNYHGMTHVCDTPGNLGSTFFNNNLFGNTLNGMMIERDIPCTMVLINENYGGLAANGNADVYYGYAAATAMGGFKVQAYNSTFASPTEFGRDGRAASESQYFISKKHDGVAGATSIWKDYWTPAQVTETPQNEASDAFNYDDNLWEKSITGHTYTGTGTEDSNLNYDISSANLSGGPYHFRVVVKTAGNCATPAVFDVFRNLVDVGDVNCGSQFTDSTGLKFTVDGGVAAAYVVGDLYNFTAWDASNDSSVRKTITMMTSQDTFTVGSGSATALELRGQKGGSNTTTITRGSTGGYQFDVKSGGIIDAASYSFNFGGGIRKKSALRLGAGAVVMNLSSGSFDNFAVNNGTDDSFIAASASLIGSGTPSKTFNYLRFVNTTGFANCNMNAVGSAAGYWEMYNSYDSFSGEAFDCDDGVADGTPGMLKWTDVAAPKPDIYDQMQAGGMSGGATGGGTPVTTPDPDAGGGVPSGGGGSGGGTPVPPPPGGGGQGGGGASPVMFLWSWLKFINEIIRR